MRVIGRMMAGIFQLMDKSPASPREGVAAPGLIGIRVWGKPLVN